MLLWPGDCRRVRSLIRGLPLDAAVHDWGRDAHGWSADDYRVAMIATLLDSGTRRLWQLIAAVNSPRGKAPEVPWPALDLNPAPRSGVRRWTDSPLHRALTTKG